jgi:hypothetical protein
MDATGMLRNENLDGDNQSLRGFLRLVETEYPDELLRVRQPVDLHYDPTAQQDDGKPHAAAKQPQQGR